MGLDISYYAGLIAVRPRNPDEEPDCGQVCFWHTHYPERAPEIAEDTIYSYASSGSFCAGSYSGYNRWRDELAQLAGYPKAPYQDRYDGIQMRFDAGAWAASEGPFWELINFSDCEGTIGASVSAKLAKDFAEYQPKADAHRDDGFRSRYAEWRKAFETAQNAGAVSFH